MHVDISLLGGFAVVVDGRAVAAHAWTRRSAATLVKVLALGRAGSCPASSWWTSCGPTCSSSRRRPGCTRPRTTRGRPWASRRAVVLAGDVVALLPDARGRGRRRALRRGGGRPVVRRAGGDRPLPRRPAARGPLRAVGRRRARAAPDVLPRAAPLDRRWADLVAAEPLDEEAHLRLVHQYVEDGDRRPGPAPARRDGAAAGATSSAPSPARPPRRCAREAQAMPPRRPRPHGAPARRRPGCPAPATRTVGREADVAARPRPARRAPTGDPARHRRGRQDPARGGGRAPLRRGHSGAPCYVDLTKVARPRPGRRADRARARHPRRGEPGRRPDARGGPAPAVPAARARQLRARRRRRRPRGRDGPVVRRPPGAGDQPGAAARRG